MFKWLKRIKCKHNYKTVTNLFGDAINDFSTGRRIIRSIKECRFCGKWIESEYIDDDSKVVNFKKSRRLSDGN